MNFNNNKNEVFNSNNKKILNKEDILIGSIFGLEEDGQVLKKRENEFNLLEKQQEEKEKKKKKEEEEKAIKYEKEAEDEKMELLDDYEESDEDYYTIKLRLSKWEKEREFLKSDKISAPGSNQRV